MPNINVLSPMIRLKQDMLDVSAKLKQLGYAEHAAEMKGAAKILQTWINGIRNKHIGGDNAKND